MVPVLHGTQNFLVVVLLLSVTVTFNPAKKNSVNGLCGEVDVVCYLIIVP